MADYSNQYLTFVVQESGEFFFRGNSINYSLDSGSTWTELASNTFSPTFSVGQKIMWKGTMTPESFDGIGRFISTCHFAAEGNPMSLLFGDNFSGQTDLTGKDYAFYELFSISNISSAENLVLPATTLSDYCYYMMFRDCTSLTTVPELPATTLASHCYDSMFESCTSLTTVPSNLLPATTLASHCYESMFYDCTSLTNAPQLPAITLAEGCYFNMFGGCTSLTSVPNLPATTLASSCYLGMFAVCTSLTTVPSDLLPATTLAHSCYRGMFLGCTSLTTAPELPATTLAPMCYYQLFSGCTSLNYIKCLATDISASYCTTNWVNGVASSGTFVKSASMNNWAIDSVDGIPSGWTVQDYSEPIYRWAKTDDTICVYECDTQYRTITGAPFCDGYDKCVNIESQVSNDCGETWQTTATTKNVIEHNSSYCGYIPPSGDGQHDDYLPNKGCSYTYDKLDKIVYLVDKDEVGKIYIDDGEAYINGYTGTPLVLHGYNINFTEESSFDERYKFQKQVTFSLHGWADRNTFLGKYYVIIQSKDKTKWLVNVDFPSIVTYDFRLNASEYQTTFTLNSLSNFPTLKINAELGEGVNVCKHLYLAGIDSLQIIEKELAKLDEANSRLYIDEGFRLLDVDFNKNSCSLEEQFDGDKVTTTVGFSIPFSSYESSWHYNLLEFTNNRYRAIIKPKNNDNVFYVGFNFGLEPSYNVTATTTNNSSDIITVTLKETSNHGSVAANDYEEHEDTTKRWRYINSIYGITAYECIGNGIAMYLLKQEVDGFGVPTGNYQAYTGRTSQFPTLNIVGEFSEQKTYSEPMCDEQGCSIITDFPNPITFNSITCQTYTFSSTCNWRIMNIPSWLTISPISGQGSTSVLVQICSTIVPPSTGLTGTFGIGFGNNLLPARTVTVNLLPQSNLLHPNPQNINCLKQNVTFAIDADCLMLDGQLPQGVTASFTEKKLVVNVPANTSTSASNTYEIKVKTCDESVSGSAYINQDHVYESWVDTSDYICESGNSYVKQQRYTGTTSTSTNTPTSEYRKGSLIATGDSRCGQTIRWTWNGSYYCQDGNKFKVEEEEVYNGSTWEKDGVTRLGDMVESASSFCEETIQYKWVLTDKWRCEQCSEMTREVSGTPFCDGTDKCIMVDSQISYDCGETWSTTSTTKVVIEHDSSYCQSQDSDYLSFAATEASVININVVGLSGSTDNGSTWTSLSTSKSLSLGQTLLVKGNLTTAKKAFSGSTGSFTVQGNVMSLLYGDDFADKTTMTYASTFEHMFEGCSGLTSSRGIVLPATELKGSCYYAMFSGCTAMTETLEKLPATTLANWCYQDMYRDCTSLQIAPELPAKVLAKGCYGGMFRNCSSLNYIKCLATNISASNCTYNWVASVSSSGTFVKASTMTYWSLNNSSGIPSGWNVQDAT